MFSYFKSLFKSSVKFYTCTGDVFSKQLLLTNDCEVYIGKKKFSFLSTFQLVTWVLCIIDLSDTGSSRGSVAIVCLGN